MNIRQKSVSSEIDKKPLVSSQIVAKYLLSLDSQREYFSSKKVDENQQPTSFIVGDFRLNKMLQIIQALYYSRYQAPLFAGEIKAYEHGGVVSSVYRKFSYLSRETKKSPSCFTDLHWGDKKIFAIKVFRYLRENYNLEELKELAHEDIAWQKAWSRKCQGQSDNFIYDREVLKYYRVLSGSLLKAMAV